jgi:hypothetical protein
MKRVFEYSLVNGYDVLVIHAGNDKDDPLEIPLLWSRFAPARPISSRARGIWAAAASATCRATA